MVIFFSKMHGLGNDFIVIDAINQSVDLNEEQIIFMANRNFGIGFDQLLLVEKPINENADFKYRIFNADGSEVSQCGNGARCFAKFIRDKKLSDKDEIVVDTHAGQLVLRFTADLIEVNMGIPIHQPSKIPLLISTESRHYQVMLGDTNIEFAAVSLGNPHAVIQVDDIAKAPVQQIGQQMESHALFPERANIGFVQLINRHQIKLRVYERGSAETLACGSGACAAVVTGIDQCVLDTNVLVNLPGGDLQIRWEGRGQPVFMQGPAVLVFDGQISL